YTGLAFTEKDQTAGFGIGQRTHEGGIDERKNRGIGADRDRESADGRGGEKAVPAENSGRIMEVLPDGLDHTGSLAWVEYHSCKARSISNWLATRLTITHFNLTGCRLIRPISARYASGLSFLVSARILVSRLAS